MPVVAGQHDVSAGKPCFLQQSGQRMDAFDGPVQHQLIALEQIVVHGVHHNSYDPPILVLDRVPNFVGQASRAVTLETGFVVHLRGPVGLTNGYKFGVRFEAFDLDA